MNVTIDIPTAFRRFTSDVRTIDVEAGTVAEALTHLVVRFPKVRPMLYADDGRRRRYVNVFLNARDIRQLEHEATKLGAGDRIVLVPALAGG